MAVITISIPEEIKREMDANPEVNWTEVIRRIIIKKAEDLKRFEEFEKEEKE